MESGTSGRYVTSRQLRNSIKMLITWQIMVIMRCRDLIGPASTVDGHDEHRMMVVRDGVRGYLSGSDVDFLPPGDEFRKSSM